MSATFHSDTQYNREATIRTALQNGWIDNDDESLLREYLSEKQAGDQVGFRRLNKITTCLVHFRRFLGRPYRGANIGEIYKGISALTTGTNQRGKPFAQNSLYTYMRIVKPFLHWMNDNTYVTIPEKKIKKISCPSINKTTTHPDQILTLEEVEQLLKSCKHSRDRAFISTLYESGARAGELGRMTWRDLVFDDYGVKCYISDMKTKQQRYSRLTMSRGWLATWKNDTPDCSPDARVFVSLRDGTALDYYGFVRILDRVRKAAGVERKINLHLFRKSRITHMIAQNYQESVIKLSMWGNLGTGMFETYAILAEQDIDTEFLDKAGIRMKRSLRNPLASIPCPRCHHVNSPGSAYCNRCGLELSEEAIAQMEEMMTTPRRYPHIVQEYMRDQQHRTG